MITHRLFLAAAAAIAAASCSGSETVTGDATGTDTSTGTLSSGVPAIFSKFTSDVKITVEGDMVVLKANGIPDHKSPYFATTDSRYEAYNGTKTFSKNSNSIATQSYTFRIPLNPAKAASATATSLGPIGISVNGVALFNQYNGQNRPLTEEIVSFDQYNGHPSPGNEYHYHAEPLSITKARGSSALVGFLLDGFPVYGPVENGKRMTNADLDQLHGHVSVTADYPNGIYHYHVTDEDPYINGAGFYGKVGTLAR